MEYNVCCICLLTLQEGEVSHLDSCKHAFHTNCIKKWFQWQFRCPYCRTELNFSDMMLHVYSSNEVILHRWKSTFFKHLQDYVNVFHYNPDTNIYLSHVQNFVENLLLIYRTILDLNLSDAQNTIEEMSRICNYFKHISDNLHLIYVRTDWSVMKNYQVYLRHMKKIKER